MSTIEQSRQKPKPKCTISAIIPTYNRPEKLQRALDSVLKQTVQVSQIIVVDNGNCRAQQVPAMPFINWVVAPVAIGASQARNIGASHASSDYLAFLDDDDVWSPTYVEEIFSFIDNAQDAKFVAASLGSLSSLAATEGKSGPLPSSVISIVRRNPGIVGSNIVIRADVFNDIGGFDPSLPVGEDTDLAIRAIREGVQIERSVNAVAYIDFDHPDARLTKGFALVRSRRAFVKKHTRNLLLRALLHFEYITRWTFSRLFRKLG